MLVNQVEHDIQETRDPLFEDAEIEEELKDVKLNYDSVVKEVAKAAKESLSSKTIKQYDKYLSLDLQNY